jgi:hypothetical protein
VEYVAVNARWHDHEALIRDLADLADNSPDHHTAVTAARALAIITWQRAVLEELRGTIATLEQWAGVRT